MFAGSRAQPALEAASRQCRQRGPLTSHNPIGLRGLLRAEIALLLLTSGSKSKRTRAFHLLLVPFLPPLPLPLKTVAGMFLRNIGAFLNFTAPQFRRTHCSRPNEAHTAITTRYELLLDVSRLRGSEQNASAPVAARHARCLRSAEQRAGQAEIAVLFTSR
jgi:hypothetical protein